MTNEFRLFYLQFYISLSLQLVIGKFSWKSGELWTVLVRKHFPTFRSLTKTAISPTQTSTASVSFQLHRSEQTILLFNTVNFTVRKNDMCTKLFLPYVLRITTSREANRDTCKALFELIRFKRNHIFNFVTIV